MYKWCILRAFSDFINRAYNATGFLIVIFGLCILIAIFALPNDSSTLSFIIKAGERPAGILGSTLLALMGIKVLLFVSGYRKRIELACMNCSRNANCDDDVYCK
ncbi:putative integral membrane protein [Methanococcus maripaludis]|uniref:Putative integral membrane protein n=1 Tax=Methanococcus maripaludis TaxID=39152 RepID=A0A7J9NWY5_METMI|nr:hypothetical protein [Methanococcus maripaludis]MBA2851811.1 putative integral membrane protein [Methanococcus maripaludis]